MNKNRRFAFYETQCSALTSISFYTEIMQWFFQMKKLQLLNVIDIFPSYFCQRGCFTRHLFVYLFTYLSLSNSV